MLYAEFQCLCLLCARNKDTGVGTEMKTEKSKGLQENDRIIGKWRRGTESGRHT